MNNLAEATGTPLSAVSTDLAKVDSCLQSMLTLPYGLVPFHGQDLTRQGKKLRPTLVLLSASLFGNVTEACITAAAALEAVHMASLLHDDVVDETETRHGQTTINAKCGNKFSILLGDYVLAQATQALAGLRDHDVIEAMAQAATQMSLGQILELQHQGDASTTVERYLEIVTGKTASLMAACCRIGAFLAKSSPEQAELLTAYGLNLGIAFQITDDILDIWGRSESLGKPTLGDIAEQKFTLPLLLARDSLVAGAREDFVSLLQDAQDEASRQQILSQLDACEARTKAQSLAQSFASKAEEQLGGLDESPAKRQLLDLTGWVLSRNK